MNFAAQAALSMASPTGLQQALDDARYNAAQFHKTVNSEEFLGQMRGILASYLTAGADEVTTTLLLQAFSESADRHLQDIFDDLAQDTLAGLQEEAV